jgi:hypothetical protein
MCSVVSPVLSPLFPISSCRALLCQRCDVPYALEMQGDLSAFDHRCPICNFQVCIPAHMHHQRVCSCALGLITWSVACFVVCASPFARSQVLQVTNTAKNGKQYHVCPKCFNEPPTETHQMRCVHTRTHTHARTYVYTYTQTHTRTHVCLPGDI